MENNIFFNFNFWIQWFPLSILIFGQKSCFLGPTIFEIPQPNWYYSTYSLQFWKIQSGKVWDNHLSTIVFLNSEYKMFVQNCKIVPFGIHSSLSYDSFFYFLGSESLLSVPSVYSNPLVPSNVLEICCHYSHHFRNVRHYVCLRNTKGMQNK